MIHFEVHVVLPQLLHWSPRVLNATQITYLASPAKIPSWAFVLDLTTKAGLFLFCVLVVN
ncbi:hypothetical protein RchiOBHm_Chr3g0450731 [Rosa chinensis]|uniref:Uncharacterized protein n=1 Tax=Rosa chinensis TaxID=74649 RepID=A0A2P6R5U8_ROSCH|nr:hypothetical protein RchiOBHm_Chr3g0450731 [Rosa chinensis]